MQKDDFSNLASDFIKHIPSYNREVAKKIINKVNKKSENIRTADVETGTGIFTKCIIEGAIKDVVPIEPNEGMCNRAIEYLEKNTILEVMGKTLYYYLLAYKC